MEMSPIVIEQSHLCSILFWRQDAGGVKKVIIPFTEVMPSEREESMSTQKIMVQAVDPEGNGYIAWAVSAHSS
jgi:hypothetical protein